MSREEINKRRNELLLKGKSIEEILIIEKNYEISNPPTLNRNKYYYDYRKKLVQEENKTKDITQSKVETRNFIIEQKIKNIETKNNIVCLNGKGNDMNFQNLWSCKCGFIWYASYNEILNGTQCIKCENNKLLKVKSTYKRELKRRKLILLKKN